jgi:hypothetical protein
MVGIYPIGSLVVLDTEEWGIVMETNPEITLIACPKVKIIADKDGNKINGGIIDLAEKDPKTEKFKKKIVKTLDPFKYDIDVAEHFLAQGE